jgi:hypothetical protein
MMESEFQMSMMGELTFFLCIQVTQMKQGTFVHQIKYTKDLMKKFSMSELKPVSTPMSSTASLDPDEDGEAVDQREYRRKPVAMVFFSLASKLVVTVFSSLASKLVAMVSSGLASKSMVGFLVEPQNQDGGGFSGLGLKIGSYGLVIWVSKSPRRLLAWSSKPSGLWFVGCTTKSMKGGRHGTRIKI